MKARWTKPQNNNLSEDVFADSSEAWAIYNIVGMDKPVRLNGLDRRRLIG